MKLFKVTYKWGLASPKKAIIEAESEEQIRKIFARVGQNTVTPAYGLPQTGVGVEAEEITQADLEKHRCHWCGGVERFWTPAPEGTGVLFSNKNGCCECSEE